MPTNTHLRTMKNVLAGSKPPYCAGTKPLPEESVLLFYAKPEANGEIARRIDLSKASPAQLEDLTASCLPATFGVDKQDVYDENYRRAGKLDTSEFAINIDLEHSGLMDAIRYDLLEGREGIRPIWAELYKLNVYGKDGFFKTHKDTPRSKDMFGSLVVVFPTPHEGGALLLSHGDRKWTFDSASLLTAAKGTSGEQRPHIAYVAFFSDVDHEVAKVESGHRVTITYNLHFTDRTPQPIAISALPPIEETFKRVMEEALADTTFLPDGGYLGFGFCHEYPIETGPERPKTDKVQLISRYLKGRDAVVRRVCAELGLNTRIVLDYVEDIPDYHYNEFLHGSELKFEMGVPSNDLEEENLARHVRNNYQNSAIINSEYETVDFEVLWVTDPRSYNQVGVHYYKTELGNEPCMDCAYGRFCFLVKVGKVGGRKTA